MKKGPQRYTRTVTNLPCSPNDKWFVPFAAEEYTAADKADASIPCGTWFETSIICHPFILSFLFCKKQKERARGLPASDLFPFLFSIAQTQIL